MAINKKLIHFKNKHTFLLEVANGNILNTSIVFIQDTLEIYTHGTFYDGKQIDLSNLATKSEVPTKLSQLENNTNYITKTEVADNYLVKGNYIEDDVVSDGVYAVDASGKLIDYNTADSSCIGVALIVSEHKFMIAKSDATNGSNYNLCWTNNTSDLSLTNYTKSDGTNGSGYLPKPDGTFGGSTHLSGDFTTWTAGALSDFNGKANTAVIAAASSRAKDMCTVLNTFNASDSFKDWYVPACGQLALMYLNMTEINAALAKIGGTALAAENYWSSSEYSSYNAWYVYFSNGRVDNLDGKGYDNRVRFIRDILVKPLKERVSDLESSKQDTLISGTNIKTINGTSILGSGDIVISGGSSSGGSGAYAVEIHDFGVDITTITPNVFHVFKDTVNIDFQFGDEIEGVVNEYVFQFTTNQLMLPIATFPDTIQWANGEPIFDKTGTYQISIVNNIGLIVSV